MTKSEYFESNPPSDILKAMSDYFNSVQIDSIQSCKLLHKLDVPFCSPFFDFLRETVYSHSFVNASHSLEENIPDAVSFCEICRLVRVLTPIRLALDAPITVNSWYRSPAVNELVGGVPSSNHLYGRAVDISTTREKMSMLWDLLSATPHRELIKYRTFYHFSI